MPADTKILKGLKADITRLEKKVDELQGEILIQVNRLHGAMDERDSLRAQLRVATLKAASWDAACGVVDALKNHTNNHS